MPIPGPKAAELCDAFLRGDRPAFRRVVDRLRLADATLVELLRQDAPALATDAACVGRRLLERPELPRYCRVTPPRTGAEHRYRELLFRRAFLESAVACLEERAG